jgi:hypothetical protein
VPEKELSSEVEVGREVLVGGSEVLKTGSGALVKFLENGWLFVQTLGSLNKFKTLKDRERSPFSTDGWLGAGLLAWDEGVESGSCLNDRCHGDSEGNESLEEAHVGLIRL